MELDKYLTMLPTEALRQCLRQVDSMIKLKRHCNIQSDGIVFKTVIAELEKRGEDIPSLLSMLVDDDLKS